MCLHHTRNALQTGESGLRIVLCIESIHTVVRFVVVFHKVSGEHSPKKTYEKEDQHFHDKASFVLFQTHIKNPFPFKLLVFR